MSEEQQSPLEDDFTRATEPPPIQRRPRELPRRGYESQPRPMNPPPPPPIPPSQSEWSPSPPPPTPSRPTYQPRPAPARGVEAMNEPIPRPHRASRSDSGLYLPWWSLVILVLVAGVCSVTLLVIVMDWGSGLVPGDQTPQVIVVTNALNANNPQPSVFSGNTNPPGFIPPTQETIASAVPLAEPTETLEPGRGSGCPLNATVEVRGTEGLPLLIRTEPRQGDNIQSQAAEGEFFHIVGGPEISADVNGDSLEWCKIEGITVPSRVGWAARQFLVEVQE